MTTRAPAVLKDPMKLAEKGVCSCAIHILWFALVNIIGKFKDKKLRRRGWCHNRRGSKQCQLPPRLVPPACKSTRRRWCWPSDQECNCCDFVIFPHLGSIQSTHIIGSWDGEMLPGVQSPDPDHVNVPPSVSRAFNAAWVPRWSLTETSKLFLDALASLESIIWHEWPVNHLFSVSYPYFFRS